MSTPTSSREILPDDILRLVLSPQLTIPTQSFFWMDKHSPFSTPTPTFYRVSSELLLVSKQWMRVATSLLYNTVILRSSAQAQALLTTLTANPEFGLFIRQVRLEGGFGATMYDILSMAPNVEDLVMTLDIWYPDSPVGVMQALKGMTRVKRLGLMRLGDEKKFPEYRKMRELVGNLMACIMGAGGLWPELTEVHYPFQYARGMHARHPAAQFFTTLSSCTRPIDLVVLPLFTSADDFTFLVSLQGIKKVHVVALTPAQLAVFDREDSSTAEPTSVARNVPAHTPGMWGNIDMPLVVLSSELKLTVEEHPELKGKVAFLDG